jgi:hypothetical protein
MKYRKKPVVIEAVQLLWNNWSEMCDFANVGKIEDNKSSGCFIGKDGQPLPNGQSSEEIGLLIPTLEGLMVAREKDFIIRGVKGELYPCKPDIFEATYDKVEDAPHNAMEQNWHIAQQPQPKICPRCGGTKKVPGPFGGPATFTCVDCDTSVIHRAVR